MSNLVLTRRSGYTWMRGFGTLLEKEAALWLGGYRWLKQLLIWLVSINLLLFLTTLGSTPEGAEHPGTFMLFGIFSILWGTFGVIIINSGSVVNEKKDGSAAWLLSKPVSRTTYLLSKFVVNTVATLILIVIVPSLVFYVHMGLWSGSWLPFWRILVVIGLLAVNLIFYTSLIFLCGTFFESSSTVTGLGVGLFSAVIVIGGNFPISEFIFSIYLGIPLAGASPIEAALRGFATYGMLVVVPTLVFATVLMFFSFIRFNKSDL